MLQIQSLKHFQDILEEDIQFLWCEQKVEEDFVCVFVTTGFDMLENPNNTKVTEVKEMLCAILQRTMERFGADVKQIQSRNTTNIINLLYNQDNLAPHMAEFVALVAEK